MTTDIVALTFVLTFAVAIVAVLVASMATMALQNAHLVVDVAVASAPYQAAQDAMARAMVDVAHARMMRRAPVAQDLALLGSLDVLATLPAPVWARAECPMVRDVRAMRRGCLGGMSVVLSVPTILTLVVACITVM